MLEFQAEAFVKMPEYIFEMLDEYEGGVDNLIILAKKTANNIVEEIQRINVLCHSNSIKNVFTDILLLEKNVYIRTTVCARGPKIPKIEAISACSQAAVVFWDIAVCIAKKKI